MSGTTFTAGLRDRVGRVKYRQVLLDRNEPIGDTDLSRFAGTSGDNISAQMIGFHGYGNRPRLELYRPDGTLFDSDYDSSIDGVHGELPVTLQIRSAVLLGSSFSGHNSRFQHG